ncbi:MAG: hypothetical protein ACRDH5_02265 [bacterium]
MKKTAMWTAAAVLVLTGGLFAYPLAFASGARADCPGKIICPITGEEICKDQCPLGADRTKTEPVPSCCRAKK